MAGALRLHVACGIGRLTSYGVREKQVSAFSGSRAEGARRREQGGGSREEEAGRRKQGGGSREDEAGRREGGSIRFPIMDVPL